jgi:hypothetical protein
MTGQIVTLGEVLAGIERFPWNFSLYSKAGPFSEKSPCAVLDPEDSPSPSDEPPALAKAHGMKCILTVQAAQDIAENARQQLDAPSVAQLVAAFNYYWVRSQGVSLKR